MYFATSTIASLFSN